MTGCAPAGRGPSATTGRNDRFLNAPEFALSPRAPDHCAWTRGEDDDGEQAGADRGLSRSRAEEDLCRSARLAGLVPEWARRGDSARGTRGVRAPLRQDLLADGDRLRAAGR